eukprot:m.31095 g.31095  ORF g.31095 m.31095 type:complete len:514 (-) comp12032_c0_seq1:48-1589(-)
MSEFANEAPSEWWSDEPAKPVVEATTTPTASTAATATPEASATPAEPAAPATDHSGLVSALNKMFLVDLEAKELDIQRSDKSSPMYSASEFEDVGKQPDTLAIPDSVLKACAEKGFKRPSKIQSSALPILLRNSPQLGRPENLIFQSQAGTGKTAAFTINMLARCDVSAKHPQALYVSPTYNLSQQTQRVIQELGKYTGLGVAFIYGVKDLPPGAPQPAFASGKKLLQEQIVCATLGKLQGELAKKPRNRSIDPAKIKIFVIDEADALLAKTYGQQDIKKILAKLPANVQVVLLSATFEESVMKFALEVAPEPHAVITLPVQEVTIGNVKQLYMDCYGDEGKFESLCAIYESVNVGQTIIFVNERRSAFDLQRRMQAEKHKVAVLTGGKDMTKAEQTAILERFRQGKDTVLVTTDVLSRGIDVPSVSMVVNYDVPIAHGDDGGYAGPGYETYAHRIGRTGRFGKKGTAVTLLNHANRRDRQVLDLIQEHYASPIEEVKANDQDIKAKAGQAAQ